MEQQINKSTKNLQLQKNFKFNNRRDLLGFFKSLYSDILTLEVDKEFVYEIANNTIVIRKDDDENIIYCVNGGVKIRMNFVDNVDNVDASNFIFDMIKNIYNFPNEFYLDFQQIITIILDNINNIAKEDFIIKFKFKNVAYNMEYVRNGYFINYNSDYMMNKYKYDELFFFINCMIKIYNKL